MVFENHKGKLLYSGFAILSLAALLATDSIRVRIGAQPDKPDNYLILFPDPTIACCGGTPESPYSALQVDYPTSMNFDSSGVIKISMTFNRRFLMAPELFNKYYYSKVTAELHASAFTVAGSSSPLSVDGEQKKWQWVITPKNEGKQVLSIAVLRDSGSDEDNTKRPEIEVIHTRDIDINVLRPFLTTGQLNLANILMGIVGGLLAVPSLTEWGKKIREWIEKRKKERTPRVIGFRITEQQSEKSQQSASARGSTESDVKKNPKKTEPKKI